MTGRQKEVVRVVRAIGKTSIGHTCDSIVVGLEKIIGKTGMVSGMICLSLESCKIQQTGGYGKKFVR